MADNHNETAAWPDIHDDSAPDRLIRIVGQLEWLSDQGIYVAARRARLDDRVKFVVVEIDAHGETDMGEAAVGLFRLGQHKPAGCVVKRATGTACQLMLAAGNPRFFPQAVIGDLRATEGSFAKLRAWRPEVTDAQWLQLATRRINGEAAEFHGFGGMISPLNFHYLKNGMEFSQ